MKPLFPIIGGVLALLLNVCMGQTVEEFELTNGRRVSAASVKPTAAGFSAVLITGANSQNINFTAKDVVRAHLREPAEIRDAKKLIASGNSDEAIDLLEKLEAELAPFRKVRGAWWHRAVMLRVDALAAKGDAAKASEAIDDGVLAGLPEEEAAQLTDFQTIVAKPSVSPDTKISALQALAQRTSDPWIGARAWIEVGHVFAGQGKIEDAVKAWLRVAVFHPAERDLAVRGTILAARGLQQIERPKDGLKLLDDYLNDHIASPYETAIKTEAAKIDPKREKNQATPAPEVTQ